MNKQSGEDEREEPWSSESTGASSSHRRQWRDGKLKIGRPGGVEARVFEGKQRGHRGD